MARRSRTSAADIPSPKRLTGDGLRHLWGLFRYLRPYRWRFGLGLLFLLLSSASTLVFPGLMGRLIDAATLTSPEGLLQQVDGLALVLVAVLVLQAAFSFMRIRLFISVAERALADLRKDLFSHMLRLPMHFFAQRRVGELMSRMSNDISQIQETFTTTLAETGRGLLTFMVGIALIVQISPRLTLVMLLSLPPLVVLAIIFGKYIRKLSRTSQDRLAEAGTVAEESLQGIQSVKAFHNEVYETRRYLHAVDAAARAALRLGAFRGAFAAFIIAGLFGAIILVMWYGARLVAGGQITVGSLTQFVIYTLFVGAAMGGFGENYAQLLKTIGATERVRELMAERPEEEPELLNVLPAVSVITNGHQDHQPAVVFEQVSFRYPSRPEVEVLKNVSFSLAQGAKVALVGPSGAGKSTVVSLMFRFYEPASGRILLQGKPLADYDLGQLRSQLALVPQEILLFGGTIAENIRYGRLDATQDQVELAAQEANAWDFIQSFPDGLDTVVGERGVKLSGGQRQRIAIARALLRDPRVLILDEATSSLDAESERVVQQALERLMHGRTTLIIAHRLATIRSAHQILVLQQGAVVEQGTHEELTSRPEGVYRLLASLQFQAPELLVKNS